MAEKLFMVAFGAQSLPLEQIRDYRLRYEKIEEERQLTASEDEWMQDKKASDSMLNGMATLLGGVGCAFIMKMISDSMLAALFGLVLGVVAGGVICRTLTKRFQAQPEIETELGLVTVTYPVLEVTMRENQVYTFDQREVLFDVAEKYHELDGYMKAIQSEA